MRSIRIILEAISMDWKSLFPNKEALLLLLEIMKCLLLALFLGLAAIILMTSRAVPRYLVLLLWPV